MARTPRDLPDYFTMEEAQALIRSSDSPDVRLVMRLMLRCGLRVSEALSLRPSHLRLDQDPPVINLPATVPGNKARRGREVPIPADLVELLRERALGKTKAYNLRLVDLSRQSVSRRIKEASDLAGIAPDRAHAHAFRHTYGRHCILSGVPVNVLQAWLGHASLKNTMIYVQLAGEYHSYVERI